MTDTRTIVQMWGGIEATVNRVGNHYYDQMIKSGHHHRITDLDEIASLGIKAIRYPVLWERVAPDRDKYDWSWTDERLHRLQELNIEPIAGLVHHGSGPSYTSLLDPLFPEYLARYASKVAQRYPFLHYYTPVNEPLTTARFSCLYGLWYPHYRNNVAAFCQALINECKAVVLAMAEIRKVNPNAKLVQTEDIGKVYCTPELADQAEFDNQRRWLTYDLLNGQVNQDHPLFSYLVQNGISVADLDFFTEQPTPPDVLGVNYYVTSERFLDTRVERYPAGATCHNQTQTYADVEAVRVCQRELGGPYHILKEVWDRYRQPIAVTEAHMGCTREEQQRWLLEFWEAAQQLWSEGVDVKAITAWSLLGAYDWDSLVTEDRLSYEPGAFDVRGGKPRMTALGKTIQHLATSGVYEHETVKGLGWWRKESRFTYPPTPHYQAIKSFSSEITRRSHARPLAIIGASGTLGKAFGLICGIRGLEYKLLSRKQVDITQLSTVEEMLKDVRPWAVINAAGYVRVDQAELECDVCHLVNAHGPSLLATACRNVGIPFVTFSSDLVFGGEKNLPYVESDVVSPLNVYGKSKAEAEQRVLHLLPTSLIIRTSAFFGPWDEFNFATQTLRRLAASESVFINQSGVVSPTYIPDLVNATLDLFIDEANGIWHLANVGQLSWMEFAQQLAELRKLDCSRIALGQDLGSVAKPKYSVLGTERAVLMPSLDNAINRYLAELSL